VELTLPARDADGRIALRVRVEASVAEALHDEASHRRTSVSRVVERLLREGLPALAEERVRRLVARDAKRRRADAIESRRK
jgi:hypothetical protein